MKKKIFLSILFATISLTLSACSHSSSNDLVSQDNYESEQSDAELELETEIEDDSEVNEPSPEEEAQKEKERQESLVIYEDMIKEIQNDIPELTVNYVISDDTGQNTMSISMPLLESEDATLYKIAELTATKETLMNNNGIDEIMIFVYNGEENVGIVMYSNHEGEFEPTVNTL